MEALLDLPYEVQIILFAGYIAYKITTIGRSIVHRTEDFLLQVLAFGSIARIGAAALIQIARLLWGPEFGVDFSGNAQLLIIFLMSLVISIGIAALWRRWLQNAWVSGMAAADIYHDDHEVSVWASILATRADWTYVQVHCDDGKTYESEFGLVPADVPMGRILCNDDGIAMYVTRVYLAGGTEAEVPQTEDGFGPTVDYFPRSTIKRIEIGWLKR